MMCRVVLCRVVGLWKGCSVVLCRVVLCGVEVLWKGCSVVLCRVVRPIIVV